MVKAGLLKQGFYNGSFANLRKYARGEGFVDDAVSVGRIVSRHSNRREESIRSRSQVFGADLFKIAQTVFSETGMKDSSGTPLKGLPKECEARDTTTET